MDIEIKIKTKKDVYTVLAVLTKWDDENKKYIPGTINAMVFKTIIEGKVESGDFLFSIGVNMDYPYDKSNITHIIQNKVNDEFKIRYRDLKIEQIIGKEELFDIVDTKLEYK